jgi:hypothetical protein
VTYERQLPAHPLRKLRLIAHLYSASELYVNRAFVERGYYWSGAWLPDGYSLAQGGQVHISPLWQCAFWSLRVHQMEWRNQLTFGQCRTIRRAPV